MKKRLAVTLCSLFAVGMFTGTTMALEPDPWENNQKNKIENPAATKTLKKGGNITSETKAMNKTDGTANKTNKNFGQKVETKSTVNNQNKAMAGEQKGMPAR